MVIQIVPCGGLSNVGQLTLLGSKDYAEKNRALLFSIAKVACGGCGLARDRGRLLIVDGCDEICGRKIVEQQGQKPDYHLILTDLGIEKQDRTSETLNADEKAGIIELVVDGIEACCAEVDGVFPQMTGPCGCCS